MDIAIVGEGRYRLDPELVEVDCRRFATVVTEHRTTTVQTKKVDAYRQIVEAYQSLVDGMSTEWLESVHESTCREALDAVAALARALGDDPSRTLNLLEMARAFDPHDELVYRDIMRLQARLGQFVAIPALSLSWPLGWRRWTTG